MVLCEAVPIKRLKIERTLYTSWNIYYFSCNCDGKRHKIGFLPPFDTVNKMEALN